MKKFIVTAVLALVCLVLVGCGGGDAEGYQIYYLSAEGTKLVSEPIDAEMVEGDEDDDAMVGILLDILSQPSTDDASLQQPIGGSVVMKSYSTSGYQVTVDFDGSYYDLSTVDEVLIRAAIVNTLIQIPSYPYVMFTVDGSPLVDASGAVIGSMNADTFVANPGSQINTSQQATLTLYFASEDGTQLVEETRAIRYSSNISLEKLVLEQLLEGPNKDGSQATIPSGTKLINVSVADGICYVSLDDTFLNQNQEISEQVVLFSIVDSLTELANVDKVQISINGDTSGKVRYAYDLATLYEADYSLLAPEVVDSTEDTEW